MEATTGAFTAVLTGVSNRATRRVPAGNALNLDLRSRTTGCETAVAREPSRLPADVRTNTNEALVSLSCFGAGLEPQPRAQRSVGQLGNQSGSAHSLWVAAWAEEAREFP